ncbi:MAG: biotin--[acetyl-CoA-carboxylase] ligase [Gammaproteobacteria bacterium]|nr:biotin--[acetyl-CoA-carboxylase] ligase [Gammaproteobacteria bacterium]
MSALTPEQLLLTLGRLATGEPVAVEALAEHAGVSPEALSAMLPKLVDHGVRQRRDGSLRVPGGVCLLDAARISAAVDSTLADTRDGDDLDTRIPGRKPDIQVFGIVGSTNDLARARVEAGGSSPAAILAEAQTAGRGRRGRAWTSPVAANIYLSQVEALDGGLEGAAGLSLAVGVAVADALEAVAAVPIALKWPNDLLARGRKLGGILVELVTVGSASHAILGIGINVRVPAYTSTGIDQAWIDLAQAGGGGVDRNLLAASIIAQLSTELTRFRRQGFDANLRQRWQARDPFLDRRVVARSEQGEVRGWGRGIDERGEFVIETASGTVTVGAGEVSLRLEEPA